MLTLQKPVTDQSIVDAISLACSPVLGALNFANAVGGHETDAWRLVREQKLSQLIDEAAERGIDLSEVKAACCDILVFDTPPFHGALRYDPRPRCASCNRRHSEAKGPVSCGATINRFSMPEWHWTKWSAMKAMGENP